MWLAEFKQHRDDCYPNECVGVIDGNNNYVRCDNTHPEPMTNYRLDGKILLSGVTAICHSHTNGNKHPSYADTDIMTRLPQYTYHILVGDELLTYNRNKPQPLLGREFVHYIADCYGLVRDYYYLAGIVIKEYPRSNLWWENGGDVYRDGIASSGFVLVGDEIKTGDVLLMQINAPVPNHSAIYVGDGKIIQHFCNRLSRQDDLSKWKKYIVGVYRYANKT